MGGFAESAAMMGLQMAVQHQASKQAVDAQNAQIAQQNQLMAQEQQRRAKQRRDLLERQMAGARAAMAAGGGGFAGGSGAAVLAGLRQKTEEDIADEAQSIGGRMQGMRAKPDFFTPERTLQLAQWGRGLLR